MNFPQGMRPATANFLAAFSCVGVREGGDLGQYVARKSFFGALKWSEGVVDGRCWSIDTNAVVDDGATVTIQNIKRTAFQHIILIRLCRVWMTNTAYSRGWTEVPGQAPTSHWVSLRLIGWAIYLLKKGNLARDIVSHQTGKKQYPGTKLLDDAR